MELRHLRYFVAVAEELNFSHAALRLHVSQPPLSRQIRDLEAELGVELFSRAKNKVQLTPAGESLLQEAKDLLIKSEELIEHARRYGKAKHGKLQIGYVAHAHGQLIIDTATQFRQAHPGVAVTVFDSNAAEQVAGILSSRIDLGFVGFPEAPTAKGLHVEPIGTTYAVMALARQHRFARRKTPALTLFQEEPFVTVSEDSFPGARQYVIDYCRAAGFEPRIIHETAQPIDILNLVAIGEGVALVPERMRQTRHAGVVFVELSEPVPRVTSYAAWKSGNTSPWIAEFVELARRNYTQLEGKA